MEAMAQPEQQQRNLSLTSLVMYSKGNLINGLKHVLII